MLAGCAQNNADRISIDFEPLYPQEMPLVETNNGSGTIFNAARGNLFSMESKAQQVGDIITVSFAESFQATKSQNAATSRSLDNTVNLPGVANLILPTERRPQSCRQSWQLVVRIPFQEVALLHSLIH